MGKYLGKNDFDKGTEFLVNKNIVTSYGTLAIGQKVTLLEVTHFPTSYKVLDKNGKEWLLRTYDVDELSQTTTIVEK
tara:strand:- start:258 stop:488 length:231 start_codon:yes stop_codon:yes gene_type:complete